MENNTNKYPWELTRTTGQIRRDHHSIMKQIANLKGMMIRGVLAEALSFALYHHGFYELLRLDPALIEFPVPTIEIEDSAAKSASSSS